MGSAGHAFISHTKALSPKGQVKDGGYGSPPHPLVIRTGQRFWPRAGRTRRPFILRTVNATHAHGKRLDGDEGPVRVTIARLLARRDDGQGLHYQFQGFAPRRYPSFAYVCEVDERYALLSVPEWHPDRPVELMLSLVPEAAREVGAWIALRCDLSAPTAGRLQPSHLTPAPDPGPQVMHRPGVVERHTIPQRPDLEFVP